MFVGLGRFKNIISASKRLAADGKIDYHVGTSHSHLLCFFDNGLLIVAHASLL